MNKGEPVSYSAGKLTKHRFNSVLSNKTIDQIKVLKETADYLRSTNNKINDSISKNSAIKMNNIRSFFLSQSDAPLLTEPSCISKSSKRKILLSPKINTSRYQNLQKVTNNHYCPFCDHCNKISDKSFETLQYHFKETSNTIAKSTQYILKKNYKEFSSFFNDNFKLNNTVGSNGKANSLESDECNSIESLLYNYPRHQSPPTKDMYKVLNMFLHSLINNKIALEDLIKNNESFEHNEAIMNKFIKGFSYVESSDTVLLDKEFESLFDVKSKDKLIAMIKEEYLNKVSKFKEEIAQNESDSNKRLLVLFLILTECIAEIFNESKDRAILLYKVYKMYFVELNKKLMNVIDNFKAKIDYYRELCKGIVKERTPDINNITLISNILCDNTNTYENLQKHKEGLNILLSEVYRFKDQYYTAKSQLGLERAFCKKWIYGYDKLKSSYYLQKTIKELDIGQISEFIKTEVASKEYSEDTIVLLINVEIFQRLSGVKNYLFEQKYFYQKELARLTEVNQNLLLKKKRYKEQLKEEKRLWNKQKIDYEEQIATFKSRFEQKITESSCQTDIDYFKFNKYQKDYELIEIHKRLTVNKIDEYLLRIKYKCSKYIALSKMSLLKLIPELFNEKIEHDEECEKKNLSKMFFGDFFLKFFQDKFQLKKIIQQNTEETIMAIVKYSTDDKRIDYFRRFLAIGSDKIRREILDIGLIVLAELPFSYYKIFYEDKYESFTLPTDFAFEILGTRFKIYYFIKQTFKDIINASNLYDKNNKKINKAISIQTKEDMFYLYRLYKKGNIFINDLMTLFKNETANTVSVVDLMKNLEKENIDFGLNSNDCLTIIEKHFNVNQTDCTISLIEFFDFFSEKKTFKIPAFDFFEISIVCAKKLLSSIENKASKAYENVDIIKIESISKHQFNTLIESLIGNQTNNWKMNEFFTLATNSGDIEFIGKEEFISFVLNTNDILMPLIKKYIDENNI